VEALGKCPVCPPLNQALVVINDKSQGTTAKHLSCDGFIGLLHYKFIIQFTAKKFFLIGEHLAKLQAKWLIVSHAPFALDICLQ